MVNPTLLLLPGHLMAISISTPTVMVLGQLSVATER